jgi:F-type H+-transporting ATPase subunit b
MQENIVSIGTPIIFQALSFVLFYLIMRRLLYHPLSAFMEKRRRGIEEDLASARRDRQEAKQLKEDYAKKIEDARREAADILNSAGRRGDILVSEARQEARRQAESFLKGAREEIRQEKLLAFTELQREVGQLSILVAQEILKENLDHRAQEKTIEAALEKMGGIS